MKNLILLLTAFFVCSCEKEVNFEGGGSVSSSGTLRNIKTEGLNETDIIASLEEWLIAAGYEKPAISWVEFAATSQKTVPEGERTFSDAYVKNLTDNKGSVALSIAPASEEDPYVTVFQSSRYQGDTPEEIDQGAEKLAQVSGEFEEFIDTTFPGSQPRGGRLSGRPRLEREKPKE